MSDLLRSAPRIVDLLRPYSPSMAELQHAGLVTRDYLNSEEKIRNVLRLIVNRIFVRRSKVELQLSKNALAKLFLPSQSPLLEVRTGESIVLEATAQLS